MSQISEWPPTYKKISILIEKRNHIVKGNLADI